MYNPEGVVGGTKYALALKADKKNRVNDVILGNPAFLPQDNE